MTQNVKWHKMSNGTIWKIKRNDKWHITYDTWQMTNDTWNKFQITHFTRDTDTWHMRYDVWCMTHDVWCMMMMMMMMTTTMMMRTETLTSSPTRTPSNFLMIRFKDLSSSSRWKSWSSSLTSSWLSWPFMPSWLWWPKLVILSHDDQKPSTWFAAIALFKLQQYQAASGVCLFSSIM